MLASVHVILFGIGLVLRVLERTCCDSFFFVLFLLFLQLLEPSLPQLCDPLTQQSTAAAALQVFLNVALARPRILADDQLRACRQAAEDFPKTAGVASVQVMVAVAKERKVGARDRKEGLPNGTFRT